MKKSVSILLSLVLMFNIGIFSFADFSAPMLTESEFDEIYYNNISSNTLPTLNVGSDETSVSLCWHANKDTAKAEVKVSKQADMGVYHVYSGETTPAENENQLVCRVTVTGLEENTAYYYQWYSDNGWSDVCRFETKGFTDHKALVIGDIQIGEIFDDGDDSYQRYCGYSWNSILSTALTNNPDISYLVTPGDNTSTGNTSEEWQTFLMPEAMRSLPMAMAIGNHDKKGMTYNYYTNMPNEYYGKHFRGLDRDFWCRYGDVLYLFFDSTSGDAPDHMAFAQEAVELNQDAKWRIGVVHHGIYGAGDAIGDTETELLLTNIFAPIFESYDLDFVITGHTHSQGRSHFMENNKIVGTAESGQTYTDPEGIVYLNSNAVCGTDYMDFEAEHLAYAFMENDCTTYTTLEFVGDKMIVETRRGDNNELLDSITIVRTQEHNENSFGNNVKRIFYKVIELLGLIYVKVDELIKMFG